MGINIKYYILTVVSIFLALGIGIFIGFMFDAQEILAAERQNIVYELESKFKELKNENKNLTVQIQESIDEREKYKEFSETFFPYLIKNRLKGLDLAIIQINDNYDYSEVYQTLDVANANIVSSVVFTDSFFKKTSILKNYFYDNNRKDISNEELIEKTVDIVVKEIMGRKDNSMIKYLNNNELANINLAESGSVDYIIIAGGSKIKDNEIFNNTNKKIIDCFNRINLPIVGVEKKEVVNSYIDFYKKNKIITIDNIDSVIGKTALILIIEDYKENLDIKTNSSKFMIDFNKLSFR
ncbi:copper transporter [Dethiothermospora halolimnae]|uniref:copper transporter n=1 Tax=Dethiothermospora halolimnae TaxID=3114390 RepID=UPI003CCB7C70